MVDTFQLWMESLNPADLARETFHSAEHRAEMARHEAYKKSLEYDTPKTKVFKPRLSYQSDITTHRKEPVFTPEQIRIAQAVQERKAS